MTPDRQPPLHRSFGYALKGILLLVRTQRNARIHLLITLLVIGAGAWFHITRIEWALIVFATGLVWTAEALNSAIEYLADAITQDQHPLIGHAKDLAAAGVLLATITAVIVGAIVFLGHLLE